MGGKMTRKLKSGKADMPYQDPKKKAVVKNRNKSVAMDDMSKKKPAVTRQFGSIERGIRRALGM